jgi:hypothetical protein
MKQKNIIEPPELAEEHVVGLKRRYTSAQKWAEVVKLRDMAWKLKWASIKQAHPEWNDEEIKSCVREIFLNAST